MFYTMARPLALFEHLFYGAFLILINTALAEKCLKYHGPT